MMLSAVQRCTLLDFPDRVACIAFTPGCNLRCGFCHNPEFVLPEHLKALSKSFIHPETFFHFLERRRGRLDGVVVSGGEPTIWPDLPEFMKRIKQLGFLTKLDTNGNNPTLLEHLITEKLVDYIAMDVKTSPSRYRSLVGAGITPAFVTTSLALLRKRNIPYELRTTVIREHHTRAVFQEMAAWLKRGDVLWLQPFRPGITLRSSFAHYHGPTSETYSLAQQELERRGIKGVIREEGGTGIY